MHRLSRFLNTIKYLKPIQIYYRLFYIARKRLRQGKGFTYSFALSSYPVSLSLMPSIAYINRYGEKKFTFINLSHTFENIIDWNFPAFGKLWTYNLTYFDFLNQETISKENGLRLINNFINQSDQIKNGLEPFPISLRGINWIKFLVRHNIENEKINNSLFAQYQILIDNLEYHILGNHLLENGFSLLFGAYYFQDARFYRKAKEILIDELEEQILQDGAHFELSPMYHQLMLYRILDCINLLLNNRWKDDCLLDLLKEKASSMLGWLNEMTFENGNIPLFNDSAYKIAPTTKELNTYAYNLNLKTQNSKLSSSGYRKIKYNSYEMLIDVGNIGPDYIPGHAHSDTFNFELYVQNQPVIVDTGLSTYELNDRRQLERSTKSHNTVEIDGENQSEVWGGFRVAKRAKIIDLKESNGRIEATHDGYKHKGIWHTRKFIVLEDQIIIKDSLETKEQHSCVAYFHFHPDVNIHIDGNVLVCKYLTLNCTASNHIELIEYDYSPQFNTKIKAQCAKISFHNELETKITIGSP